MSVLSADYKMLLGQDIPYAMLGYKSMEEFLSSSPTLITSRGPKGEFFVDAKPNEKSAHISDLVNQQKTTGPKKKPKPMANYK